MPTQRTKKIVINKAENDIICLAAQGMHIANESISHCGHHDAYGGFYTALQNLMNSLSSFDPDFMEAWDSTRIQCSLDLSDWRNYPKQIKNALDHDGIEVILE